MRTAGTTKETVPGLRRRRRLLLIAVASSLVVGATASVSLARSHRRAAATTIGPSTLASLGLSWTSASAIGPLSPSVSGGRVYVGGGDSLSAYPGRCTLVRGSCPPLWLNPVPDGPLSTPVEQNGVVYTGSTGGLVYAFPSQCSKSPCPPLWVGQTGPRALSPPAVNSDFVYVASDELYVFPASCGTLDQLCPPAWTADLPGPASDGPPAVGGGLVVVASRGAGGGVSAFPAVCSDHCQPTWTGWTGGPTTGVTIADGTAYAVARGQLFAFSLGCRGRCEPSWTGPFIQGSPFGPGAGGRPAAGSGRLYVGALDGHLWVFPMRCRTTWCNPIGSLAFGGDPLTTPVVQDGLVFAVSKAGLVTAIVDGCSPSAGTCSRPWSEVLGARAGHSPAVTSTGVFVGDDRGTIYAYALPPQA